MCARLNEAKNRDCDYIISVNFVTFLILWKIGKHEEAKRYVDINRKLIEVLLDEDQLLHTRQRSESQLSVILEQSNHNISKMGMPSRTINESFETGESIENTKHTQPNQQH